jgi:hypothetical protein
MAVLEAILDETRAALLTGDLSALAGLAAQAEAADLPSGRAALHRVKDKAARNATLIGAALKGLRAARRNLAEAATPRRFRIYDASGRRDEIGPIDGAAARRV